MTFLIWTFVILLVVAGVAFIMLAFFDEIEPYEDEYDYHIDDGDIR